METTQNKATGNPWTINRFLIVVGWLSLLMAALVGNGIAIFVNPFAAIILLPGLIFTALLAWKPRPWVHLVAAILISIPSLFVLAGEIDGLAEPVRGSDFITPVFILLALLLSLPAGIAGFRAGRKGVPQPDLKSGWRSRQGTYASVAILVALGAIVTSWVASTSAGELVSGGYDFTPSASVSLITKDDEFAPKDFAIKANTITEIVVENKDTAYHNFIYKLDGKTYSHDLLGGKTARFLVLVDKPQTIDYICKPHERDGMVGKLTVQ